MSGAGDGTGLSRSVAQRASQLASVAAALMDSGGRGGTRPPFEASHPLVSVLRHILRKAEVTPLIQHGEGPLIETFPFAHCTLITERTTRGAFLTGEAQKVWLTAAQASLTDYR